MSFRSLVLLAVFLVLIAACSTDPHLPAPPALTEPVGLFEYQVGLGYGFLGRQVRVSVDGEEVFSLVGTEEIEDFAQLLGTKMLGGGSTGSQLVNVMVIVDGGAPIEQVIDLNEGGFIHIYYQESGVQVFNTSELVLE